MLPCIPHVPEQTAPVGTLGAGAGRRWQPQISSAQAGCRAHILARYAGAAQGSHGAGHLGGGAAATAQKEGMAICGDRACRRIHGHKAVNLALNHTETAKSGRDSAMRTMQRLTLPSSAFSLLAHAAARQVDTREGGPSCGDDEGRLGGGSAFMEQLLPPWQADGPGCAWPSNPSVDRVPTSAQSRIRSRTGHHAFIAC